MSRVRTFIVDAAGIVTIMTGIYTGYIFYKEFFHEKELNKSIEVNNTENTNVYIAGIPYNELVVDPTALGRRIEGAMRSWGDRVDIQFVDEIKRELSYLVNLDKSLSDELLKNISKLRSSSERYMGSLMVEVKSDGLMSDVRQREIDRLSREIAVLDEIIAVMGPHPQVM